MDYKYITQLLERYCEGTTSLEEEQILRSFFSQKDVPAELLKYRDLFCYQQAEPKEQTLGDDFDARILDMIGAPVNVKARQIKMSTRLMPLFKAAAVVAIILTLGNAAHSSFNDGKNVASEPAATKAPATAFEKSKDTLQLVSDGAIDADSLAKLNTQQQQQKTRN